MERVKREWQRCLMSNGQMYPSIASGSGAPPLFFDIQVVILDVGSYLCQTSAKAPAMVEKEKEENYLQP